MVELKQMDEYEYMLDTLATDIASDIAEKAIDTYADKGYTDARYEEAEYCAKYHNTNFFLKYIEKNYDISEVLDEDLEDFILFVAEQTVKYYDKKSKKYYDTKFIYYD